MVCMARPWKHPKTGIYQFRRAVPADLRGKLGWEIKISLGTRDPNEAKRLFAQEFERSEKIFEVARGEYKFSPKDAQALAGKWLMERLEAVDGSDDLENLDGVIGSVIDALEDRRYDMVAPQVDALIREEGLPIEAGSEGYQRLSEQVLKAYLTELQIAAKRAMGNWSRDPALDAVPEWTPPVRAPDVSKKGRERLSDMYEGWKKEQKPTDRLILERDIALNRYYDMHGDMEIVKITKGHIRQVKDRMVDKGLSPLTINKQLSHVRAVLRFAVDNGYIDDNPGAGIGVRGARRQTKARLPYSVDDLNLIFSGPVHRDGKRPHGGGGEAAFWLPLIALYSGMRMEEIGQAHTTDLKQEGGAWYIDVTDLDGNGKSVKTASSRRKVPVHPVLIEKGLIEYARSLPEGRLFPDLRPDRYGKLTTSFSKWYGRYIRRLGLTDSRKVFHSFRHTFKDALRAAGVEEAIQDAIMGHAGGGVGRTYGSGYPVSVLAESVAKTVFAPHF